MQKAFIRLRRPAVPRWRALSLLVIRMLLLLLQLLPAAAPAAVYTAISFLPGASFFPSEAQWKAWGPSRSPSVPPSAFVSVRLSPLSKPLSSLSFFSAAAERGHTSGCLHTAGRRGRGTERRCKGAQSSSRRFGFSILLNPDGATTSQQLEQMLVPTAAAVNTASAASVEAATRTASAAAASVVLSVALKYWNDHLCMYPRAYARIPGISYQSVCLFFSVYLSLQACCSQSAVCASVGRKRRSEGSPEEESIHPKGDTRQRGKARGAAAAAAAAASAAATEGGVQQNQLE